MKYPNLITDNQPMEIDNDAVILSFTTDDLDLRDQSTECQNTSEKDISIPPDSIVLPFNTDDLDLSEHSSEAVNKFGTCSTDSVIDHGSNSTFISTGDGAKLMICDNNFSQPIQAVAIEVSRSESFTVNTNPPVIIDTGPEPLQDNVSSTVDLTQPIQAVAIEVSRPERITVNTNPSVIIDTGTEHIQRNDSSTVDLTSGKNCLKFI